MLIWVVEKSDGEPTPDSLGREIWRGGYQGDALDATDQLPASLLAQGESTIEIARWHRFSEFEQALAHFQSSAEAWTSLAITTALGRAEGSVSVQISSTQAILLLCTSVLELVRAFGLQDNAWIRVE